eukprot:364959-Chlamydomonas_euryale.AAC.2
MAFSLARQRASFIGKVIRTSHLLSNPLLTALYMWSRLGFQRPLCEAVHSAFGCPTLPQSPGWRTSTWSRWCGRCRRRHCVHTFSTSRTRRCGPHTHVWARVGRRRERTECPLPTAGNQWQPVAVSDSL